MSTIPSSFSALLPGAHVVQSVGKTLQRVETAAVASRQAVRQTVDGAGPPGTNEQTSPATSGKTRPTFDLLLSGTRCAKCKVYLYQAPFSPAVRYVDGEELFAVPAGWAILRTRGGLLLWLELSEDANLLEAIKAKQDGWG
ncbi:UBP18 [Symbiodinium necroappetens]|uniref:UBP18 protein n=1 Tax=Symbiodinium necroappetens TaxID=1628268 RepID=A0A812RSS5_9DINO|nr:UBP18 [Symbiodinium necroappetens]